MQVPEMSPQEAQLWLKSEHPPRLIDVREPDEWEICRIDGAELIPLSHFAVLAGERFGSDLEQEMLIYCHHGMRSAHATQFLQHQGFTKAVNLAGGIDRWSCEVDPSVPRY